MVMRSHDCAGHLHHRRLIDHAPVTSSGERVLTESSEETLVLPFIFCIGGLGGYLVCRYFFNRSFSVRLFEGKEIEVMCGHPPELEMLCDECFSKNQHHDCETCTCFDVVKISTETFEVCTEDGGLDVLPDERKCFLYAPNFCKECTDNLERLCFCCGVQFNKPVDGCCEECR